MPAGAAHTDYETTFRNVDKHLQPALKKLGEMPVEALLEARYQKFRKMGVFEEK